jgi:hypothetical protein
MAIQIQLRRGTAAQHTSFVGVNAELTVDTTNYALRLHNGSTAGGIEILRKDLANLADSAILNSKLANSSVTINGQSVSLGGSTTITATATNALTIGTGLSGSSYNGSSAVTIALSNTGVTAAAYGSATQIPVLTINAQGQITAASTASVASSLSIAGDTGTDSVSMLTDTLTISGGTGLSSAVTNNNVTLNLDNTTVTAGSYGSATAIPTFTVDAQGRLTAAGTASISTTLTVAADSGTADSVALGTDTLTFTGGTGLDSVVSNNTITFNIDSTVATLNGTQTLTNKTISGASNTLSNIGNSSLTNSSVTIGSTTVALGATSTSLAGITELTVDNINVNGNTISSTDTNGNIIISPNGTGKVDVSGSIITGLNEPVDPTDAATKSYVDTIAQGLHVHEAARVATTDTLATLSGGTVTYANGTAGVGATLTLSVGITTLDGVTLANGDRILVKNQTNQAHNGMYVRTSATVLTRATDFDTAAEIGGGDFTFIEEGTLFGKTGWVQTFEVITVGTDNVIWEQFAGQNLYIAGTGLTLTGNQFDVVGTADRITANANSIDIASTYVGQTSITTLGTVGTGTWNGTVIDGQYGGTGVNNSGKTITLGGNLTTSGAFTTTLTATANTSVTLPTTGTLATLAGTETLTNKTIAGATISGSLIPSADATYDLGSAGYKFKDLYLSGSSLFLNQTGMQTHASGIVFTHSTNTTVLPIGGGAHTLVTLVGTETLTNKTLSAVTLTGATTYSAAGSTATINYNTGSTPTAFDVRVNASGGNGTQGNGDYNIISGTLTHNLVPVVTTSGTQSLSNKTLVSPTITGVSPTITLGGDLTGSLTLTDLAGGTLTATIAANSVALGTDTTGNYASEVVAGNGITVTGTAGEGTSFTVAHADTSSVSNLTATSRTYVTGLTFDTYGHVQSYSTASETVSNTTYSISAETATGGAKIQISGSDSSIDDVKLAAGSNINITRTDANTITIEGTASSSKFLVYKRGDVAPSSATSIVISSGQLTVYGRTQNIGVLV